MSLMWAAGGAVAGLLAGAALRGTVFRLSVASGDPDRTACSQCGMPAGRWLAVRCGHCGRSLGPPLALELTTAAVLALLLGRFGGQPDMIAFGFFGVLGVALSAIDVAVQRLPDPLTLPAYPILIALLALAGIASHDLPQLADAVIAGNADRAAELAAEHFSLTEAMLTELHARIRIRSGGGPDADGEGQ
jgi:leader peptidase (prepilin peptidase) / N-methyltransferase